MGFGGNGGSVSEVKGTLMDWASYPEVGTSKERKRKIGYDLGAGEEETWKRPTRARFNKEKAVNRKWMRKQDEEAWQEQGRGGEEDERIEAVEKCMREEELVRPSSSDTEEHHIRIRQGRFQEGGGTGALLQALLCRWRMVTAATGQRSLFPIGDNGD